MLKFLSVALLATAPAYAAERHTFTRDGETYSYTLTEKRGAQIIDGRVLGGPSFHFVVRNGHVTGYSGTTPVSFRTGAPVKGEPRVEVVSR